MIASRLRSSPEKPKAALALRGPGLGDVDERLGRPIK
jgi:hypothetical protein